MTLKLIICSNKGLLKGDILIDDHISGRGQEFFEGKLIHFGQNEYPKLGCGTKALCRLLAIFCFVTGTIPSK